MAKLKKLRGGSIIEVDPQVIRWQKRRKKAQAKAKAEKAKEESLRPASVWSTKLFE